LERIFGGSIAAKATIIMDGKVSDATITAANVGGIGRSPPEPYGYDEAVLAAMKTWQYPRQPHACIAEVTLRFDFV